MIWFKLLSNPITKLVVDKTMGAIQHKLDKDKIIKAKEIEAAKELGVEQVKAGKDSWKDEWITFIFSVVFISHFIPALQQIMLEGWNILKNDNENFWYLLFVIVGGSFGMNTINKFKKK